MFLKMLQTKYMYFDVKSKMRRQEKVGGYQLLIN